MNNRLQKSLSFLLILALVLAGVELLAPKIAHAITCGTGSNISFSDIGGGQCQATVTSGTSFTVPTDWSATGNYVEAWGGGGGGGGDGSGSAGTAGTASTFNGTISAGGGSPGQSDGGSGAGGAGGTASGGNDTNTNGQAGSAGTATSGKGGDAPNGGAGGAGVNTANGNPGTAPGGGGSGGDASGTAAGGGGSGAYVKSVNLDLTPGGSVSYTIGSAGSGGSGGATGGAGALGRIVITYTPSPVTPSRTMRLFGALPGAITTSYLTSGTSYTVPSDWNSTNNTIEVIGGGGGGGNGKGGGGGGGAYSKVFNASLTPGASVTYAVGSGGATDTDGGDTYFCNSTSNCASIAGTAVVVGAKAGVKGLPTGSGGTGGAGGSSSSGVGSIKRSGGTGADTCCTGAGGGGGGAAGANGAGNNGSSQTGGSGDAGFGGSAGSGGSPPTAGGAGTEWDATHGSGGGGGGSNSGSGQVGGAGGAYGGGGGGGPASTNGGAGAQGIIVIKYAVPVRSLRLIGSRATPDFRTAKTVTASGNAQIDTAQSKFGGASALFDGTGDDLTSADNADWNLGGTGGGADFTLDFWVRFNSTPSNAGLVSTWNTDGWELYYAPSVMELRMWASGLVGGVSWNPSTNTWYHVALVRSGTTITVYIDGTSIGTIPDFDANNDANSFVVGAGGPSGEEPLNGWIDEVRVSKGIARWTSNFTLPTTPYTHDQYTKLLLHMDGADAATTFTDQAYDITPNRQIIIYPVQ